MERECRLYVPRRVFIKITYPPKLAWTTIYFCCEQSSRVVRLSPNFGSMTFFFNFFKNVIELQRRSLWVQLRKFSGWTDNNRPNVQTASTLEPSSFRTIFIRLLNSEIQYCATASRADRFCMGKIHVSHLGNPSIMSKNYLIG
jgi:hypothetical protein